MNCFQLHYSLRSHKYVDRRRHVVALLRRLVVVHLLRQYEWDTLRYSESFIAIDRPSRVAIMFL